ncbi:MAG: 50S ribosomal protein L24 [Patescibacteria group bacterium]
MRIKKGDNVIVTVGKDRGKEGKVTRVFPARNTIVVEGVNMKKKHQRARKQGKKGQIVDIASPINASNVMIKDPKTGKPTRIGIKKEDGKNVRFAKKSGSEV